MDESAFCKCKDNKKITSGYEDDYGYWDVCTVCGKRIESGYHYYNHYDGEDHEVFWGPNGDIIDDQED